DPCERPGIDHAGSTGRRVRIVHRQVPVLSAVSGFVESDDSRRAVRSAAAAPAAAVGWRAGNGGVHYARIARRDAEVCLNDAGQAFGELLPRVAAVSRLEDA